MATTLCTVHPVLADTDVAMMCEKQGADAERLAIARDRGLTVQEAIAAVQTQNSTSDIKQLVQAAELLFHRFRNMPIQQVAFEFTAACIDDSQ